MLPPGFVSIPLGKGCVLLLTKWEYLNALRRGKWWRRREAEAKRAGGEGTCSRQTEGT